MTFQERQLVVNRFSPCMDADHYMTIERVAYCDLCREELEESTLVGEYEDCSNCGGGE